MYLADASSLHGMVSLPPGLAVLNEHDVTQAAWAAWADCSRSCMNPAVVVDSILVCGDSPLAGAPAVQS